MLLMTACSKEETVTVSPGNADICFSVAEDGNATRVASVNFDTSKQFRVYAWDSDNNPVIYMIPKYDASNIVSYNSSLGVWATTQRFYWPSEDTELDFYAFYPIDVPFDTDSRNIIYSTSPIDGHSDLLYAKQKQSRSTSSYTGVSNSYSANINFRHALSRIDFSANVTGTGLAVTIHSVEICNILGKGTFNFPEGVTTSNNSNAFGNWDATTLSMPTTYQLGMSSSVTLTSMVKKISSSDGRLYMIPQTRSAWVPADNTIAANAPIAVRACKKAINDGLQVGMDEAIVIEEKLFGSCFETKDQKNAMGAFLEKRPHDPFENC